jgi:hypothetical protein
MPEPKHAPVASDASEERLARALDVLAVIVAENGPKHQPLYDMIQDQLDRLRGNVRSAQPQLAAVG